MAISIEAFAAKVKEKYPEYKGVDDVTLARKVIDKYPEYKGKVDLATVPKSIGPSAPSAAPNQDFFGKSVVDFLSGGIADFSRGAIQQAPKTASNLTAATFDALSNIPGSPLGFVDKATKNMQGTVEGLQTGDFSNLQAQPGVSGVVKQSGETAKNWIKEEFAKTGADVDSFATKLGEFAADIAGSIAAGKAVPNTGGFVMDSLKNTAAVTAASEGRMPNPTEAATGLAFDAVIGRVGKKFNAKKAEKVQKLMKSGLKEQDSYLLSTLDDNGKLTAEKYFDAGLEKLKDRTKPGVFSIAGQEIDDFYKQAKQKVDDLGREVGRLKPRLTGQKAQTEQIAARLDDLAKEYGMVIDKKGVVKSWGDIEGAAGTAKMYQKLQQLSKKPTANARALESLTSEIDRKLGIYANRGLNASDPAVKALVNMKNALNDTIEFADPLFGKANKDFAIAIGKLKRLEAGGMIKVGKDKAFDAGRLLSLSQGNASKKQIEALKAIDELGKTLGIKAPQNMQLKANLAELATRVTGTKNATSLGGIVESSMEKVADTAKSKGLKAVPVVGEAADSLWQTIKGQTPQIEESVEKIIKAVMDTKTAPTLATLNAAQMEAVKGVIGAVLVNSAKKLGVDVGKAFTPQGPSNPEVN